MCERWRLTVWSLVVRGMRVCSYSTQRCAWIVDAVGETACECRCALDRLGRALGEEGEHGVSGISQQCASAMRPLLERLAVQKRPATRRSGRPDQFDQTVVPAVELGEELIDGGSRRPGLRGEVARGGKRDEVDELSRRYRIVDQVVVWTDP